MIALINVQTNLNQALCLTLCVEEESYTKSFTRLQELMDILFLDSLYQAQLRNKASDILHEKHICKFLIQSYLLPLNLIYKSNNYFPLHLLLLFCVLTLQVLIEVLVLPPNLVPHLLQAFDDVLILTIF